MNKPEDTQNSPAPEKPQTEAFPDIKTMLQLAVQGDTSAMVKIAQFYGNGLDSPERIPNYKEASRWFKEAIQQGSIAAMHQFALFIIEKQKSYTEAMPWLRRAAETHEYLPAMRTLADLFKDEDSPLYDPERYEFWLMKCGRHGDPASLYELGMVISSKPATLKGGDASQWFEKAAEAGHRESMYQLGIHYAQEDPKFRDKKKSLMWYLKAAEAGVINAFMPLGQFFMTGEGVRKNYIIAYALYLIGDAKNKDDEAQAKAQMQAYILRDSMKPEQIKSATALAGQIVKTGKVSASIQAYQQEVDKAAAAKAGTDKQGKKK